MRKRLLATTLSLFAATGVLAQSNLPFDVAPVTSFDEPWALAFLPDGRMLVTERKGNLFIVTREGQKSDAIDGVPDVAYGGQGGLGDTRGAAVARATLSEDDGGGYLFRGWRGNAFVAGLSSQAIVRIELNGNAAREVERYGMGARIRGVHEGPDGAIWVLKDEVDDSMGRLFKLTPRS